MNTLKFIGAILRETIKEWQEDGAASVAASLAYYAIFSLSPLLILIALFLGVVLDGETIDEELMGEVESIAGEEVGDTLRQIVSSTDEQTQQRNFIGTVIWFSVIIWGASGLFAQLQSALNKIWEVRGMPGRSPLVFFKNRLLSLIIVISAGILLLLTLIINTGLNVLILNFDEIAELTYIIRPLQFIVTMAMLTVLFAMVYKVLPDVIIQWKDIWVGAAFTGFLFFIGQFAVGIYLSNSDVGSVFGAAGSLTVILVWIYYSAQILLFGAEFTEVWARHHGAYIRPDGDAVWINEDKAREEIERAGGVFIPKEPVPQNTAAETDD